MQALWVSHTQLQLEMYTLTSLYDSQENGPLWKQNDFSCFNKTN